MNEDEREISVLKNENMISWEGVKFVDNLRVPSSSCMAATNLGNFLFRKADQPIKFKTRICLRSH